MKILGWILLLCLTVSACNPAPVTPTGKPTIVSKTATTIASATVRPSTTPVQATPTKAPIVVTAETISRSYSGVFLARVTIGGGSIILWPSGQRDIFDVTGAGVYRQYEAEGLRMDAVDPNTSQDKLVWVAATPQGICLIPDAYVDGHKPAVPPEEQKTDVTFKDTCWGVLIHWQDGSGRHMTYVNSVDVVDPFALSAAGYIAIESGVAYVTDEPWDHTNDIAIWELAGRIAKPAELTGPQTECTLLRKGWFPSLTEQDADRIATLCPGMTVDERYVNTNIVDSMGAYVFSYPPNKPQALVGKKTIGAVTVEDTGPVTGDPSRHLVRLAGNGIVVLVPMDRAQFLVFVPYGQDLLESPADSPFTRASLDGATVFSLGY